MFWLFWLCLGLSAYDCDLLLCVCASVYCMVGLIVNSVVVNFSFLCIILRLNLCYGYLVAEIGLRLWFGFCYWCCFVVCCLLCVVCLVFRLGLVVRYYVGGFGSWWLLCWGGWSLTFRVWNWFGCF